MPLKKKKKKDKKVHKGLLEKNVNVMHLLSTNRARTDITPSVSVTRDKSVDSREVRQTSLDMNSFWKVPAYLNFKKTEPA